MFLVSAALLLGPFCQAGAGPGAAGAAPAARPGPLAFPTTRPSTGGEYLRFLPIEPGARYGGVKIRTEEGVDVNVNVIMDGFRNFTGGIRTSKTQGLSFLDLFVALDTHRLLRWPGGLFAAEIAYGAGDDPTKTMVGDVLLFDLFDGPRYLSLYQLWYEQKMADDWFRVRVGKIDANGEFNVVEYGLWFVSKANQINPTNYLIPTTPGPMPGVTAFLEEPDNRWYIGVGGFYSNRASRFGNFVGPASSFQPARNGAYLVQEAGVRWRHVSDIRAPGDFKAGAWQHTGVFPRLGGGEQRGTAGYYLIFDQTLWQPPGAREFEQGIGLFLAWGQTEDTVQPVHIGTGGGIAWTGPFASRSKDVTGFAVHCGAISPRARHRPKPQEISFEIFYRALVRPWMAVQPDLQYIITPGGRYDNALVMTLRLQINY